MRARFTVFAALAACHSNPSQLDHAFEHSAKPPTLAEFANDPWAGTRPAKHEDDDKGFDLQGTLERIRDGIDKPGPYEAPEKSPDFDAAKPHWGMLRLHGSVVEREAFSWTGGR